MQRSGREAQQFGDVIEFPPALDLDRRRRGARDELDLAQQQDGGQNPRHVREGNAQRVEARTPELEPTIVLLLLGITVGLARVEELEIGRETIGQMEFTLFLRRQACWGRGGGKRSEREC